MRRTFARLSSDGLKRCVKKKRADIRADHYHAILMFDVPPPFLSQGLDAYLATWETFFSSAEKPVAFAFHDVQVNCGQNVGFAPKSLIVDG